MIKGAVKKAVLDNERLKEVLDYDEETGVFRWKKLGKGRKRDLSAGGINGKGYRLIRIDGTLYYAHRLAWLYAYGEYPKNQIDHVNGNKDDNRLNNLRDVVNRVNGQNRVSHRNGKLVGVSWNKNCKKWQAKIRVNGNQTHIGYYDTEKEGHKAYLEAAE